MDKKKTGSVRAKRRVYDIIVHTFLVIMAIIWVIPFVWIIAHSFRGGVDRGMFSATFFPREWTLDNYTRLFTDTATINFTRMFLNTLIIAICTCILSTFIVLAVSYVVSRLDFRMRRPYMNMSMIINLFPGFMAMVAIYFLLKAIGLTEGAFIPVALIIVYSAGSGVSSGFYIMKGYMDTIPKELDEAASIDGATKWETFIKVMLPICKPMIVYQIVTSFMGPWVDFIFAKVICGTKTQYYTVSIGLYSLITSKEYVSTWFTRFCAGAVLVAVPISVLYIITQRFYQEAMSGAVKG